MLSKRRLPTFVSADYYRLRKDNKEVLSHLAFPYDSSIPLFLPAVYAVRLPRFFEDANHSRGLFLESSPNLQGFPL